MSVRSIADQWNNRALWRLLWPLMVEQILGVTIGVVDTVMVASVGEHAVSGVSIVDALNILLIIAFGALATGGTVVVSQFIGRRDEKSAGLASRQLIYASTAVSLVIMAVPLTLCRPLLSLIYGQIAADVMAAAEVYFILSAVSYPFLAIYNAAASLYRAVGNSRIPMLVAILVNFLNVGGNALFIFGFGMGVAGAALSTLIARAVAAGALVFLLMTKPAGPVSLAGLFRIRLNGPLIRSILNVGIPSGLENSMFQIGKILVSRIFTTFGTAAIAANAVSGSIASFVFMPAQAFAIAMLTIVGQCVGAKDYDAAKRFTGKLMRLTYGSVTAFCVLILVFLEPLLGPFNLSPEARALAVRLLWAHSVWAPVSWPLSFSLPNALRAAGDARYCMVTASVSMWAVRVSAAYLLAYTFGLGPVGVWYAMIADWYIRAACYAWRWFRGRWQTKQVLPD